MKLLKKISLKIVVSLIILIVINGCSNESEDVQRMEKQRKAFVFEKELAPEIKGYVENTAAKKAPFDKFPYIIMINGYFLQENTTMTDLNSLKTKFEDKDTRVKILKHKNDDYSFIVKGSVWKFNVSYNMDKKSPEKMIEKARGIVDQIHENKGVINGYGAGTGSVN